MAGHQGCSTHPTGFHRVAIDSDRVLDADAAARVLAVPPDELHTWANSAAQLDAGQVVAIASLAGARASDIFKLVKVLLNYV